MSTAIFSPGTIEPNILYTLEEAKQRTGWGAAAFRTARRRGLRVLYQGRRGFVKGSDLIRHIEEHEEVER